MFNKVLASIGVGNTKVDAKLESDVVTQGEEVRGVIEVQGGNANQNIDALYLTVQSNYIREVNDHKINDTANIEHFLLTDAFMIGKNEYKKIPFSFILPLNTPITLGRTKVWFSTGADIQNAVDPSDLDYIKVKPSPLSASILKAMDDLGFGIREAICEAPSRRLRVRSPFVQEFEFVPIQGDFQGRLDEVEIGFLAQTNNEVELFIEVDRKARFGSITSLLAESMDMDETKARLTLTTDNIMNMTNKLYSIINAYT